MSWKGELEKKKKRRNRPIGFRARFYAQRAIGTLFYGRMISA